MGIFPKTLPRAENGGINWTNTQFLADLRSIIVEQQGTYYIIAPEKVLSDYNTVASPENSSSTTTVKYGNGGSDFLILERFKVLEQIQRDIYPPLQQYINLLNIEAWYAGRQKRKWKPSTAKPKSDEIIPVGIITPTSPRIPIQEPIIKYNNPATPQNPIIYSLYPEEVGMFLDFTISNILPTNPGLTYKRYPPLITNWNNIPNNPINISDPSSFFLFSQLLTAYKAYKGLVLFESWVNGWDGTYRVEKSLTGTLINNPKGDGSMSGFGRATSHILDTGGFAGENRGKNSLKDVIGVNISPTFQVRPRTTPKSTISDLYKSTEFNLTNGTLIPKVKVTLSKKSNIK